MHVLFTWFIQFFSCLLWATMSDWLVLFYYGFFLSLPWLIHTHTHRHETYWHPPKNKQTNIPQYKNQLSILSRTGGLGCAVVDPCYNQHKKNNKYLQQLWAVGFPAVDGLPPHGSWCCSLNLTRRDMWGGQVPCCRGGDCPECCQMTPLTRIRCEANTQNGNKLTTTKKQNICQWNHFRFPGLWSMSHPELRACACAHWACPVEGGMGWSTLDGPHQPLSPITSSPHLD